MKTVVIGASPNPSRTSFLAVEKLNHARHEVIPVGIRDGMIGTHKIITGKPVVKDVHTVTLYIGPSNQPEWYDYIFSLTPKRIIFNPGTENPDLLQRAKDKGIEAVEFCTLVLLSTGQF